MALRSKIRVKATNLDGGDGNPTKGFAASLKSVISSQTCVLLKNRSRHLKSVRREINQVYILLKNLIWK